MEKLFLFVVSFFKNVFMKINLLCFLLIPLISFAQKTDYVDYWDVDKKIVRSKGKMWDEKENGLWKYYYPSGQLKEEANYYKGWLHDKVTRYYENGQKSEEGYFYIDRRDSLMQSWYVTGQLKEKGYFEWDKKTGVWETWYQNGQQEKRERYDSTQVLTLDYWDTEGNRFEGTPGFASTSI